jgi:lactoylglutathione lyase
MYDFARRRPKSPKRMTTDPCLARYFGAAFTFTIPVSGCLQHLHHTRGEDMELGAFSISPAVKDIEASRAFYEKFGFKPFGGNAAQSWLILKNGPHVIGLFQGMFEKNMLTFNPGWDQNASKLDAFTDVRDLQRALKHKAYGS